MEYQKETTHIAERNWLVKEYRKIDDTWYGYDPVEDEWFMSVNAKSWFAKLVPLGKGDTPKVKNHQVFKYQLPISEEFTLELPKDIEILRVDNQDGFVYLWGLTAEEETEEFHFKASKTGGDLGDMTDYKYIGFGYVYVQMELGLYYFVKEAKDGENVG